MNLYQLSTTLDLDIVTVAHCTRPGSVSRSPPQTNYLAKLCHVNWPVVYPKCSFKIMDPVSVALPQNLRRIFVATLTRTYLKQQRGLFLDVLEQPQVIHILTHQWAFRWPKTIIIFFLFFLHPYSVNSFDIFCITHQKHNLFLNIICIWKIFNTPLVKKIFR